MMTVVLPNDTYEAVLGWPKLPDGWRLGEVAAVAVDQRDRVYLLNRGEHPVIVLEQDGTYVTSWGEGAFTRPHGLHIAPDDTLFLTDEAAHAVYQYTLDGTLLQTIGTPGHSAPKHSGLPFNRCTHTALAPNGDIYVSDGYGNSRVHRYTPDGRYLTSWGGPGTAPGEFNLPHNIICDQDGWVYVADRENHRIQVFDGDGRFEEEWHNLHRPGALTLLPGPEPRFYTGELGAYLESNLAWPNVGPRISVLSTTGQVLERYTSLIYEEGPGPGHFVSPHSIAVDSRGDVYIGDVCYSAWPVAFPNIPVPDELPVLHKLRRGGSSEA